MKILTKKVLGNEKLKKTLVLLSLAMVVFLGLSIISGIAIYWGFVSWIIAFGITSIWVKSLRSIFRIALVVITLITASNHLLIQPFNSFMSDKFPSWEENVGSHVSSWDIWFGENTIEIMKKDSLSEVITGSLGRLTEDAAIYSKRGTLSDSPRLKSGTRLKQLELLRSGPGKGLAKIMLANRSGELFNGPVVYVLVSKIQLDNPTKAHGKTLREIAKAKAKLEATKTASLKAAGWQELVVSSPDRDGFVTPITPPEAVGKRSIIFHSDTILEIRVNNGTPVPYNTKILTFPNPLHSGGLPDMKLKNPSAKHWAKFQ